MDGKQPSGSQLSLNFSQLLKSLEGSVVVAYLLPVFTILSLFDGISVSSGCSRVVCDHHQIYRKLSNIGVMTDRCDCLSALACEGRATGMSRWSIATAWTTALRAPSTHMHGMQGNHHSLLLKTKIRFSVADGSNQCL